MPSKFKRLRGNFIILGIVLLSGLLTAEVILRMRDYGPRPAVDLAQPVMLEPDPVLGWRNKPGIYRVPAFKKGDPDIEVTIWPGGMRATGERRNPKPRKIILLGGSFTFGDGISDRETFAYRLQSRFPEMEVLNFGSPGYGTYQCLLKLEEYLRTHREPPVMVVYHYIQHHDERNYGQWQWHRHLNRFSRAGYGSVSIPYCLIEEGMRVVRFPSESYPKWFGDESLAVVDLAKDVTMKFRTRDREASKKLLPLLLMKHMRALCEAHKTKFMLVLFQMAGDFIEGNFATLEKIGMRYANCMDLRLNLLEMWLANEHPNADMNAIWADCIETHIQAYLDETVPRRSGERQVTGRQEDR